MTSNYMPGPYPDEDDDPNVPPERCDEAFQSGLQAMREEIARRLEKVDRNGLAATVRLLWRGGWGTDPGQPKDVVDSCWD